MGIPGAACTHGSGPIRRHNCIRDFLASEFRKGSFEVRVEPGDLCTYNGRRPADFQVFSYAPDQDLYVDVSVVSSLAGAIAIKGMGAAALARESDKRAYYQQDLDRYQRAVFHPFVIETLGGRSLEADNLLGINAAAQGFQSGKPTKDCRRLLEKGLTALFWQEMTRMWSHNLETVVFDVSL
jgi:hypothetical protein